jgi:hypothetical protein
MSRPGAGERGEGEAQGVGAEFRDASGKLPARRLLDLRLEVRLHEAARALGDQLVQADAVDQVERVEDVALRLRHLVTVLVADQAGDVDLAERDVARELEAHHDHPRDPEEDDVEARDEHRGWIEGRELRRVLRPAERREWPERGGEPRVEHVLVLSQGNLGAQLVALTNLRFAASDIYVGFGVIPGGNAMPPPQLAADAPVLDVAHPLEIGLRPVVRHEADAARLDRGDGRLGERRDAHVPLVGEPGLEHRATAIAPRHGRGVRLDLLDQARRLEFTDYAAAALVAVEADEAHRDLARRERASGRFATRDAGVAVEDVDQGKVVAAADLVVVEVVPWRDLHAAGAEGGIYVLICDDRHEPSRDRQAHLATDQRTVALVVGVYGDRGVAQHGLRSRGRDGEMTAAVGKRVAEVPELALLRLGQHLEVRKRRVQHGIPVDETLAAVDEPFLVQAYEHFGHRGRQALVHREPVA